MDVRRAVLQLGFRTLCSIGRLGDHARPDIPDLYNRLFNRMAKLAYPEPKFRWFRDMWGCELWLSPFYLIDRVVMAIGTHHKDMQRMIEYLLKPGMICIDVGANIGSVTLHMAKRVGPTGTVYAFEPITGLFDRLKENVERNGYENIVRMVKMALYDKSGMSWMSYPDSSIEGHGRGSLVWLDNPMANLRQQTPTIALDEFVQTNNIDYIDLIKIDIEGGEYNFFKGGENVFRSFSPHLFVEISSESLKSLGKDSRDLCRIIERYGYRLFEIKAGKISAEITAATIMPDYHYPTLFCTKDGRAF